MGEKVQVAAKKPEVKRENQASHTRNADRSQSMSSPIDQILYLQRTIGNQAVQRLIKSGALKAKLKVGQPGDAVRQKLESGIGADFSNVRVHDDAQSHKAVNSINAKAFTHKNDIWLGKGQSQSHLRLMAHEAAHVIQQELQVAPTTTQLVQRDNEKDTALKNEVATNKAQYLVILREIYTKKAGDGAQQQLNRFLYMLLYPGRMLRRADKVKFYNASTYLAAFQVFTDSVGSEVLAALMVKSDEGMKIWRKVSRSDLDRNKYTKSFKKKVESKLLGAYVADAVKGAVAASGKSPEEIKTLADVHVRTIILEHKMTFFQGASNGVHYWSAPLVPPNHWSNGLCGSGAVSAGVGSIATLATAGSVIATAGIGLLVVGIGLGLAGAFKDISDDEAEYRQKKLEKLIKNETLLGFERIRAGIGSQQDMLAILCTTKALKAKLDLDTIARNNLRSFVWKQMFGKAFPATAEGVRKHVTSMMNSKLNKHLK